MIFFVKKMCLELLLNYNIQMFLVNYLKFDRFIYYTCVHFWKTSRMSFYLFHLKKIFLKNTY
jgi:hypothetical protein